MQKLEVLSLNLQTTHFAKGALPPPPRINPNFSLPNAPRECSFTDLEMKFHYTDVMILRYYYRGKQTPLNAPLSNIIFYAVCYTTQSKVHLLSFAFSLSSELIIFTV